MNRQILRCRVGERTTETKIKMENAMEDDTQTSALVGADVDTGLSGVDTSLDLLGLHVADVSLGLGIVEDALGIVDDALGTVLGLVDSGLGLGDSLVSDDASVA
jgi:hypothetical protein